MKAKLISTIFTLFFVFLLVAAPFTLALGNDADGDWVDDDADNCVYNYNPFQENADWSDHNSNGKVDSPEDGLGDACDDNMKDPVITTGDQAVDEEVTLEFTAATNNGGEAVFAGTLSVTYKGALPAGMTTQDVTTQDQQQLQTKKFTWTPTKDQGGQTYSLTLVATDGAVVDGDEARVVEKTITITVADTIKEQPKNTAPTADFTWSPATPKTSEQVQFTDASSDPENDVLSYAWDFENDGSVDTTEKNPVFTFTTPGDHPVKLTVTEQDTADKFSASVVKIVQVTKGEVVVTPVNGIEIYSLQCFDTVIVGKQQVCGMKVRYADTKKPVSQADVTLFMTGASLGQAWDELIGSCTTDINGYCTVEYVADSVGTFTVTSIATKGSEEKWDLSMKLTFTYKVWDHAYDIVDLAIFNSTQNMQLELQDNEYYRGEGFYIKFRVVDKNNNNVLITDPNLVTKATLVSFPGGFADLLEFQKLNDGWYYFQLPEIPLTHDFKGDSAVFSFAFNFQDQKGAEAKVDLTILNNPPVILLIPDQTVDSQQVLNLDLAQFESDKEDSGSDLTWEVSGVESGAGQAVLTAAVVGKTLTITPIKEGSDTITLTLIDLDGDSDQQDVVVTVTTAVVEKLSVAIGADKTQGDAPLEVQFSSAVQYAVGAVTYLWNFGDATLSNEAQPKHTFTQQGVYNVVLTVVDAAQQTATASLQITVTEAQVPTEGVAATFLVYPTEGEAPLLVNFAITTASKCAVNTLLDFGDGSPVLVNVLQTSHVYGEGVYTATLFVDAAACGTKTFTQVITVGEHGTVDDFGTSSRTVFDWARLSLVSGEEYHAGDVVIAVIDFTNEGSDALTNVEVSLSVPELGVQRTIGTDERIGQGESFVKVIYLQLPFEAARGTYDVRASLHGYGTKDHADHFHRTKFRQLVIN